MATIQKILPSLALLVAALTGNAWAARSVEPALSGSVLALSRQCAGNVHPLTMGYLVASESSNNRFAIGVNGNYRLPRQPANVEEATATIRWLQANGFNFDVGWGQVNSGNFVALGVTGESLLDGCTNLRASAQVLSGCYAAAAKAVGEGQTALHRALSCYNTGSQTRGFRNGYVSKLLATATRLQVPALEGTPAAQPPGARAGQDDTDATAASERPPARSGAPGAFGQAAGGAFAASTPGANPNNKQQEHSNAGLPDPSKSTGGQIP